MKTKKNIKCLFFKLKNLCLLTKIYEKILNLCIDKL
jgi:hypothetical protein